MKHTPGPWTTFHDTLDNRTNGICIYGNPSTPNETHMGVLVGCTDTLDPENEDHAEEMLANAERIVACVNALEGVKNPEAIKSLLDALNRKDKDTIGSLRSDVLKAFKEVNGGSNET